MILSRSGDSNFIIWIQLVDHSEFIYLITGNKSRPCCLQMTQSEEGDKIQILPVTVSDLWGGRGAGQLCFRVGVWDEQTLTEDKVGRFSEHGRKLFMSLVKVFLTFAHIMGSATGLRLPHLEWWSEGRGFTSNNHTRGRQSNSWQEGTGTCLSEKPLCWPQGDQTRTV